KYPNKTLALVIVDGSLRPFNNPERMRQFVDSLRAPNYKGQVDQMVGFMVQPVKDQKTREEIRATMTGAPQHVMVGGWEAMLDEAIWKQDKINAPTLAIMVKQPQRDAEYEKSVRDLVPGIDYQVWEGVSHFLMMDEPQKFNDTVLAFLKKNNLIKN